MRIGAVGDQQLGGGVGADTIGGAQRGIDLSDKDIHLHRMHVSRLVTSAADG